MNLRISLTKVLGGAAAALLMTGVLVSIALASIANVAVTSPTSVDIWRGTHDITWTDTSSASPYNIFYSSDFTTYSNLASSEPSSPYSWDTTAISDGTYKIKIVNASLEEGISDTFTVDNTAPTLTTVLGTDAGPVQTDTINITTADATSGVASQEYGFSTDNVCDATDTYGNAFTSGVDFDITGDHTDYLCAKATDNAGNIGYELVGQLNTDNTAPSVLSYTLDGGSVDAYFNPNSDTVAIDVTANEIVTWNTIQIQDVATGLEYKNKFPGTSGTSVSTTWDGTLTSAGPLPEGAYELFYTITDLAGNVTGPIAGPLGTHHIIVDTVKPTMDTVVATTIQGAGDTIVVTFSEDVVAADGDWTDGDELGFHSPFVTLTPVDSTNADFSFNPSTNVLTVTLDEATDAEWLKNGDTLRAYVTSSKIEDFAGNQVSAAEEDMSIDGDIVVPTVSSIAFDEDRQVRDADTVEITVTFSEEMENTPQIAIDTTGTDVSAIDMAIGADRTEWTYNWDVPAGSDGAVTITITGEDLAGNTMVAHDDTSRVIDNIDPTVDTFTKPVADTVYRVDTILTFTASDTGTGAGPVCTYSLNGGGAVTTTCAETDLAVAGLAEGRNTIEVTVTDEAGNTDSDGPVSFVYDTDGILTVDDTPGNNPDFDSIQGAIDAWVAGITQISVAAGAYAENVTVDQAVTVQGVAGAVLTAPGGTAMVVTVDDVTIDGMTIENPTAGYGIVATDVSGLTITNNILQNIATTLASGSAQAIYIYTTADEVAGLDISDNTITNIGNLSLVQGASGSAKGIFLGDSSGTDDFDLVKIERNNISNIFASGSAWPAGRGAYGILVNHGSSSGGQNLGLQINDNTIDTLEGLWAHAIGLETDTSGAEVTGNTISNLTDHKGGTDAVAIFFESNPSIATITVEQNKMSNSALGVALHSSLAATSAGVLDASENWWGDATGPYNANSNPAGLGVAVWPAVDDGEPSYVKFSPFYNSDAMADLVSADPIDHFDLDFSVDPQAVNNPSTLTVTARDASNYLVVNDTTTGISLVGDNGSSFGSTLLTMEADGDTDTTITNTITGVVNVTALEVGGSATGAGTIEFIPGSDVTAPSITDVQATSITTTGATITWTTDEASTSQVEYGTTSAYGTLTSVDATMVTSHSVDLTSLTEGTDYHFRVISLDASSNPGTSTDNTFTTVAVDSTPPTITLLGQNPLTLTVGDAYVEAGATANDDVDGDITASIVIDATAVNTAVAGTYAVTYNVSDSVPNAATTETRTVIVTDPAATPVIPTVVINGATVLATYSATEAAARFPSGLQFDTTNAVSATSNGSSVAAGATITAASSVDAITIGVHVYNVVVTSSTGDTANITVSYEVTADFDDTATLAVTGIDAVQTYATADDSYANGWSWTYHVTVPTGETQFKMKFSDFISGANTIPAASNIRFYTAQASANADDANAITIAAADTYSTVITLDADLESGTAGRQIDVTVEMKVPVGSAGGSYSGSYGVFSDTI